MCGAQLAQSAPAQEVRKTVTVVFSDLKGSTNLGERLDTETLREVLSVYFNEMRTVLERHGGTVEKYIGDAIMAVFGLPKLHEDDAVRAVRAAFEMKQTLERVNERLEERWGVRLENRTGVNTGEVVAGDVSAGQRLVTGDTVNTAARLEQAAPAREILIGEPTYRLVRDAVKVEPVEPLELKGKAERVPAYRLLSVTLEEGIARRHDTPMVGRLEELRLLMDSLARAESDRRCQLVTVFGPAGVGKSRLLREFLVGAGNRVVSLRGRCLSYGDGITFWPLAEILREAADIGDDDPLEVAREKLAALAGEEGREAVERVAAAIGLSEETFSVQETFWGARQLIELLARDRPTVVLIDDIHWAEDTFLDLLRYLAEKAEAAVVVVCSSRPELLEDHADWVVDHDNMRRIVLEPLSEHESSRIVENLLGSDELDQAVRKRIVEAAEGNPLFVEQMLSMLIDDGVLARDDDGSWILLSAVDALMIPPTIAALLTARLDRLGGQERAAIERGAVIGQVFFRGAIESLAPDDAQPFVGASLRKLVARELIRPHDMVFAGEETYRFEHVLIRDAAYGGLLKRTRAELHERFVDWLEQVASDRIVEYEEIRGYHLEQAYLILSQLTLPDDHVRDLGRRGSLYLSSAGHRALARGDMPAAANLLQRAAALTPESDPARPRLLLDAGDALLEVGELSTADSVLAAAIAGAGALGHLGLETTARLARLDLHYTTDPESSKERIVEQVEQAIAVLEEASAHDGLARAWRLLTHIHWTAGSNADAQVAALRTIENARLAGDRLMETRFLPSLAYIALYGPTPVSEAIALCEELLQKAGGDRRAEGLTLSALSHLEAMQSRFDRSRELYRRSRAIFEEYGWNLLAALTSTDSGVVELLAGDPAAAEAELRKDYETLTRMGEKNYISTVAALLSEALYEQGRNEEAEEFTAISQDVGASDDVLTQFQWRSVRARVLARRRDFEAGETLAREAARLIQATDQPHLQANALMALAEVLYLSGKQEEAGAMARKAIGLYEQKGSIASADRTRRFLEDLLAGSGVRVPGDGSLSTG